MDRIGNFKIYIQYFFLFLFTLLFVPASFYHRPVEGIDASWDIAIHLAYKYHLVFGKDFVFTYGPLGILHSRHPISINLFVYLLFDLYFLGTLFFVMKKIFASHFGIGLVFFIFFGIITTMNESFEVWYFFFFLFYLFSLLKEFSKRVYLIQAMLLSLILFYFKMSLGMIVIIIFFAIITYLVICRKINYKVFLSVILIYPARSTCNSCALTQTLRINKRIVERKILKLIFFRVSAYVIQTKKMNNPLIPRLTLI